MLKQLLGLLFLFPLLTVSAADLGAPLESVIAEKGQPVSRLERGAVTVLTYPDAVIRLEAGKVVSVKQPAGDYATGAVAAKPLPKSSRGADSVGIDGQWTTDYSAALATASGTNRKVFLFFTGSDWCGWCKRLDAEILGTPEFQEYARENLVLVKLDFPRNIPQPDHLKAQNAQLSQQYQIEGYPTVVVLNNSGSSLGRTGYLRGGPGPFIAKIEGY